MSRIQFRLKDALCWMLLVCFAVGALAAYGRFAGSRQRDAIQQAIKAGHLKAENE
jgi:hypothetical protein